jgi:deoxyadenosine/deoxycytidine kinase
MGYVVRSCLRKQNKRNQSSKTKMVRTFKYGLKNKIKFRLTLLHAAEKNEHNQLLEEFYIVHEPYFSIEIQIYVSTDFLSL